MNKKEKLQKEIDESKRKLEELENEEKRDGKNGAIKKLSEYTIEEKVDFFDKLYKSAEYELETLEEKGYSDEDNAAYAWEEYIQILARDNDLFWKYWNKFGS